MLYNKTRGWMPVVAALIGNITVTIIKLLAAIISKSSVLFAETIHSFADTSNQFLIFIGLKRSKKLPDDEFVYGYGNERFFWALVSACGIFFIGAGVTTYQGIISLVYPRSIHFEPIIIITLAIAFVVEFYTFVLANRELSRNHPDSTLLERLKHGDPSTLAVFYEDGLAVVGVIVAAISIWLTKITGNYIWDAMGSIIIGFSLGLVAVILILKNRAYLMGRTIPEDLQEKIIKELEADPMIEKVLDFKSTVLDIGIYRIKCEIEFNGSMLLKEAYKKTTIEDQYEEIKDDYEEFKKFCADYADRIPRLVGRKIDEIEKRLKLNNPGVKYIDIEIN